MKSRFLLLISAIFLSCVVSCNKKELDDLQARIDLLEKSTLVSINAQIASATVAISSLEGVQEQLRGLIAQLEEKMSAQTDIINKLKEKDSQFDTDLKALRELVQQNSDDFLKWVGQADAVLASIDKLEAEMTEIKQYVESVESRLSGLEDSTRKLEESLQKSQTDLAAVQQILQALTEDMDKVKKQIEALMTSVQSVVVVPDYSDGAVDIRDIEDNHIYFEVYPLDAAKLLAQLGASAVSLDAVPVGTEIKKSINLPVTNTFFDGKFFIITADATHLPDEIKQGLRDVNARLLISDGIVTRTSEYFPLWIKYVPPEPVYTYTAEAVDLGLSVKWSAYNLGATRPEEFGPFFAWGETEYKKSYYWDTYKWCKGEENTLTKYCGNETYGTVDGLSQLELEDDAAHVKLGGGWRIPTWEEMQELLYSCQWTWTKNYEGTGIVGFIVTSQIEGYEDTSIFLPAAGYFSHVGEGGGNYTLGYWSSTLSNTSLNPIFVWVIGGDFLGPNEGGAYRFHGHSIRPVLAE